MLLVCQIVAFDGALTNCCLHSIHECVLWVCIKYCQHICLCSIHNVYFSFQLCVILLACWPSSSVHLCLHRSILVCWVKVLVFAALQYSYLLGYCCLCAHQNIIKVLMKYCWSICVCLCCTTFTCLVITACVLIKILLKYLRNIVEVLVFVAL